MAYLHGRSACIKGAGIAAHQLSTRLFSAHKSNMPGALVLTMVRQNAECQFHEKEVVQT